MDEEALGEASRLGLLPRLQQKPCTVDELCSVLGIQPRVVGSLLSRLAASGVVEEVPGSGVGHSGPLYKAVVHRRRRSNSGGMPGKPGRFSGPNSPSANHQSSPQHAYMAGMVQYHPAAFPFAQQHIMYYPAGMAPFQQQPMGPAGIGGGGGGQWPPRGPGGMPPGGGQQRPAGPPPPPGTAGPGMSPQMQMAPGGYHPMHQAAYYYAGSGGMAPLTPAVSAGSQLQQQQQQQRQGPLGRAGSSSNGSTSSNGWGGVPLSQSAAEAMAQAGMGPSSRGSSPQFPGGAGHNSMAAATAGREARGHPQPLASGAEGKQASSARLAAVPAAAANGREHSGEPESASQAGPSSSGSEDLSDEGGQAACGPAASSSGVEEGGGGVGRGSGRGSSSGGSSGSRRSRGNRERQPCAFFLKTGTCAYGDSCKFEHPFDKAPKVEFNSLGLPLRPGEPECSFYVKNYRCAFGHTCKFHHPELPAMSAPAGATVPMYPGMHLQYQMQYPQAASSPVLSSVLGMHLKGPSHVGSPGSVGGPGSMVGSPVMGASPTYFMPPHFQGGSLPPGFPGRAGMHPGYPTGVPGGMMGAPHMIMRGHTQQRGGGPPFGGRTSAAPGLASAHPSASTAANAAAAATATPLPAPVRLQHDDGLEEQAPASAAVAAPEQALAAVEPASPAAPAALGNHSSSPGPIMVFPSQRQASEQLASALDQLQVSTPGPDTPAEREVADGPASLAGEGSAGSGSGLPHQQPRAEMAAA